jgi:hypothetical protein
MSLFAQIYPEASKTLQTCILCDKVSPYRGWDGLCNRACYYELSKLLEAYENGEVFQPDPRVVKYFSVFTEHSHSFVYEKVAEYLKGMK